MNHRCSIKSIFSRLRRWPKIPLGLRLFLLYFVLVILTTYLISTTVMREIKPAVRQVTEELLVDISNLLAVMVSDDIANGTFSEKEFNQQMTSYGTRQPNAYIWGVNKNITNHRIYITNQQGIVIADSWQQDVGSDFSRWNDVYLTLQGKYGARSTTSDPDDPLSTVMYVASPIINKGKIIGSITVAKANSSIQPFINKTKYRVVTWLIVLSILGLIIGALVAWRINTALYKLAKYANKMGDGERAKKPTFRIFYEYGILGNALEKMRRQLDGKKYVEDYVQNLTHELKSPLSAIRGASEILQTPLQESKRQLFANNIESETARMQQLIDKLLVLSKLEQLPELEQCKPIALTALICSIKHSLISKVTARKTSITFDETAEYKMIGDNFLIQQALYNVLDNALDFVSENGEIAIKSVQTDSFINITIINQGPAIPDFALTRVTERFYSLPRKNGKKSTGLGLNFVEQVIKLHKGHLEITNTTEGVCVQIKLPTT